MAALPTTGITTSMVAAAIGEASNDVGTLCRSNKINMWSKWKPVSFNKITGLTATDLQNVDYGLVPPTASTNYASIVSSKWTYIKPTGGSSSPYRLGDFRNYNHNAIPPCSLEGDISVNRTFISSKDFVLPITMEGSENQIGINEFSGDIGAMYYAIIVKDGTAEYIKTASTTLANGGTSIPIDYTTAPFNADKTLTIYHLLSNVAKTTLTPLADAGTISYLSLPTDSDEDNITTLTITSGLGVLTNIVAVSAVLTKYNFPIANYIGLNAEELITQGPLYYEVALINNENVAKTVQLGTFTMNVSPTYFGTNTNNFPAKMYSIDDLSEITGSVVVPANSTLRVVIGGVDYLNRDGLVIVPVGGTRYAVTATAVIKMNGTQITGINMKFASQV